MMNAWPVVPLALDSDTRGGALASNRFPVITSFDGISVRQSYPFATIESSAGRLCQSVDSAKDDSMSHSSGVEPTISRYQSRIRSRCARWDKVAAAQMHAQVVMWRDNFEALLLELDSSAESKASQEDDFRKVQQSARDRCSQMQPRAIDRRASDIQTSQNLFDANYIPAGVRCLGSREIGKVGTGPNFSGNPAYGR